MPTNEAVSLIPSSSSSFHSLFGKWPYHLPAIGREGRKGVRRYVAAPRRGPFSALSHMCPKKNFGVTFRPPIKTSLGENKTWRRRRSQLISSSSALRLMRTGPH